MELDLLRSLSSYGIGNECTIRFGSWLRGGGGGQPLAYAVVLHSWSGNMGVRFRVSKCNIVVI